MRDRPFTVRRQVRWSECDPAGVVHTANFVHYVLSGASLFYGQLLGGEPEEVKDRWGFGTPTKALSMTFHKSLYPGNWFEMMVRVTEIRRRSFDLSLEAGDDGGKVFSATLSPICVVRGERTAIDIPARLRQALGSYEQSLSEE